MLATAFNANQLKTNGFDIEGLYDLRLNSSCLTFRYMGTFVNSLTTVVNGVAVNTAGQPTTQGNSGVPHWRMNLSTTYNVGKFTAMVLERWVQGGVFNSTYTQGVDINDNTVIGRFYTDVTLQYNVTDQMQVYGKVNNLFNVSPPIVPNTITEPYAASSPFYDDLGATWAIGFRLNL